MSKVEYRWDTNLWGWFGLSYASFLVIPRLFMHAMPEEWQNKMAELLEEYDATFPNQPMMGTRVQATNLEGSKLIKMPRWILNYRHPDMDKLEAMTGEWDWERE